MGGQRAEILHETLAIKEGMGLPTDRVRLTHHGARGVDAVGRASGATEPSHVLTAMGVRAETARGALRLTLGHTTTEAEVDHLVAVLPRAVALLRGEAA